MKPEKDGLWKSLDLDCRKETERIESAIRRCVRQDLGRRGVVVALSGGVDSSVVGALCVRSLGPDGVFGLLLPEKDSSAETRLLSRLIVEHLGIKAESCDITSILEAVGCYTRRDEAIRSVIPEYRPDYRCKIVLPPLLDSRSLRLFSVVVESPEGKLARARLPLQAYLQVVAATNFKQRVRKMLEYYHADRLDYAVAGTPNRQEYDQGFFVKLGDGAADFKPIAHLYKTQVYQLARYLGLPKSICDRPPTTDTYSMTQDQEEFYFSVPHDVLDLCLFARDHGVSAEEAAATLALRPDQVQRVFKEIDDKRKATRYLHMPALLIDGPDGRAEQTCE